MKKFDLDCLLYRFYVYRNKTTQLTIMDVDFPSVNPNYILTIAAHFRTRQDIQMSIVAYNSAMSYVKDYVAEFCRCDFELDHLFGTKKFLEKIDYKLPEAKMLVEGPIDEPVLGYVYFQMKTNKKDFFQFLDKHLVPSKSF